VALRTPPGKAPPASGIQGFQTRIPNGCLGRGPGDPARRPPAWRSSAGPDPCSHRAGTALARSPTNSEASSQKISELSGGSQTSGCGTARGDRLSSSAGSALKGCASAPAAGSPGQRQGQAAPRAAATAPANPSTARRHVAIGGYGEALVNPSGPHQERSNSRASGTSAARSRSSWGWVSTGSIVRAPTGSTALQPGSTAKSRAE
jgi:hypothetical protein